MGALDQLIPGPRLLETDHVEVATEPDQAWPVVRQVDLAGSPVARTLFAIRTLPSRLAGGAPEPARLRIDDIVGSGAPGFRILAEEPGRAVTVGAIGNVWRPDIQFVAVDSTQAFADYDQPGQVKVAWELRVEPWGKQGTRIVVEVRVTATDDASWRKFERYFLLVGPGSHYIRHAALRGLARDLGEANNDNDVAIAGDDLLPDAADQMTHGITIHGTPDTIWPWLIQMGCRRAGWYSYDLLDNGGVPSARHIQPKLQHLAVGDILPARPQGEEGFEVLQMEPPTTLVLGGLYGAEEGQLPFSGPRPEGFWHVTWAFALEPLDGKTTRLRVRARAAFSSHKHRRAVWIRPVHHFMQTAQLRNLAKRVES